MGDGQKRELPVLFCPKTGVPKYKDVRGCCWPYLIAQQAFLPGFG